MFPLWSQPSAWLGLHEEPVDFLAYEAPCALETVLAHAEFGENQEVGQAHLLTDLAHGGLQRRLVGFDVTLWACPTSVLVKYQAENGA